MKRFVVKKNTLPYVHQWAVIDTDTGHKICEHKNRAKAEDACAIYEEYGLPKDNEGVLPKTENALRAASNRTNKRKIELD